MIGRKWHFVVLCVGICIVLNAATTSDAGAQIIFFKFWGSSASPHRNCLIRDCFGSPDSNFPEFPSAPTGIAASSDGIAPGVGIGTIIEGNRILNCGSGIYGSQTPAVDLVVRPNFFRNVNKGVDWNETFSVVPRIMLLGNTFELSSDKMAGTSSAKGMLFQATSPGSYAKLIIRNNRIYDVNEASGILTGMEGINVTLATQLLVDNNIIDNIADTLAVKYQNCLTTTTIFNNQSSAGKLLRGYDGTKYNQELADFAQDYLLAF